MTPLAPIYLLGMAAAGIPVLLHLIYRRKAPRVFFPTIRFLRLSHERTSRRRRIQDLLLLFLRTLLFFVLALALAQFVVKLTEGSGLGRARAAVVIVMDNSYSMSTVHEGRPRYARAKEAALAILRGLGPGDRALALFTSGPERHPETWADAKNGAAPAGPHLTADLQEVHNTINRSRPSAQPGNVMAALREAQELLVKEKTHIREIYVLTDLQKLAWERGSKWDEKPETALAREEKARIPVIVFDAGREEAPNLAVRELRVSGQAFVRGAPITIDADIANSTPEPARAVVRLVVAGQVRGTRKVDIGPNGVATASFTCELPESGTVPIQVRLPEDALAVDNERTFKLEVKERIRTLIVQDAASAVDFLDQSYFLERALDPSIALGGASVSIIQPNRVLLRDLPRTRLAEFDVVFLLGVRSMNDGAAAALEQFVRQGGGLVFFAGENLDVKAYARLFAQGEDPLLPLPLRSIDPLPPDRGRFLRVAFVNDAHFIFAPFRGLNVMKDVRVYKSAKVDLHATTPMAALARLEDGQPLLLVHSVGKGKVAFLTVTADTSWSNLPVTNVFLPMIHQLVYHVCGSFSGADSLAVGAPYRFRFPETAARVDVDIRRPDGVEETVSTEPAADTNEAIYARTFTPGYYAYSTRGGARRKGAFVVNPDTTESNLERISENELRRVLPAATVRVCSTLDEMEKLVTPLREGVHLRDLFILATVLLAVFETVVSNWATPRSEGRKRPAPFAPAGEAAGND